MTWIGGLAVYLISGELLAVIAILLLKPDRQYWLPMFVIFTLFWPLLWFAKPRSR